MNDQLVLKEELEKVIATFEFILDCLSMESKIIIEKEYIERVGKDWWYFLNRSSKTSCFSLNVNDFIKKPPMFIYDNRRPFFF